MSLVKSKYKDPDRYISRLKTGIEFLERDMKYQYERSQKAIGRQLVSQPAIPKEKDEDIVLSYYGKVFDDLTPGDKVSIVCEVTAVTKTFEQDGDIRRRLSSVCMTSLEIRTRGEV